MITGLTKVSFFSRTLNRTNLQLDLPVVDFLAGFKVFLPFIFGVSLVNLEFSKLRAAGGANYQHPCKGNHTRNKGQECNLPEIVELRDIRLSIVSILP
jgi:hypothetical protein